MKIGSKISQVRLLIFIYLLCLTSSSSLSFSQQTDPFYLKAFEKAQQAFLAKDYPSAVRDFEIAIFGLAKDKNLQAKACLYLGLSYFYLRDIKACEKYLREAADLMGREGMQALEIPEEARPDLDKLMTFFNIKPAQPAQPTGALPPQKPEQQGKPSEQAPVTEGPPQPSLGQEKPVSANSSASVKHEEKALQEPGQKEVGKNVPPITLNNLKEGDLLPLEMVDTQPLLLKRMEAVYPSWARSHRIEGSVIVNALVSEEGKVIKTEVAQGMNEAPGFNQAAIDAVRKWRFSPASVKGIKVKVWIRVAIMFKVQEPG
jgi:TonB family protein